MGTGKIAKLNTEEYLNMLIVFRYKYKYRSILWQDYVILYSTYIPL